MTKSIGYLLIVFFLLSSVAVAEERENYISSYFAFSNDGLSDYGINGELALKFGGRVLFDVVFSDYTIVNRDVDTRGLNLGLSTNPEDTNSFSIAYNYWGKNSTIETESLILAYSRWFKKWGFDLRPSFRNITIYIPRIIDSTLVFLEYDIKNYGLGANLKRVGQKWLHIFSANAFHYSEDMTRLNLNNIRLPSLSQTTRVQRAALFSALSGLSLGANFEDFNLSYKLSRSGQYVTSGLEILRSRSAVDKRYINVLTPSLNLRLGKRQEISINWVQDLSAADLWYSRVAYSIEF